MSKIVIDEFNSTIFSQKMGNIIYKDRDSLKQCLQTRADKFDHLSVKVCCHDIEICNDLIKNGFYIVDTLVSYKFDYESDTIPDDQETVYKEISDIYNLELM
ncbi:hypothetical protein MKC96_18100 [[Clostridium] innocuum]|uniref:Uncharacterized protein n=1 Tax=Clostridium innocuum TaxID=1522 RepID=A0A3E2W0N1_CLOIN|nr:hypothetical protein [[Clostridium] innocuum]MCR0235262.1 hypothetical protein [[Clostridium] innocuum]MCR0379891.1 hypothetical protein [[Clostridium] innocuum]RGC17509.1 hypothetical protein DXA38_04135 [[Clostridium] innocuum]